MNGSFYKAWKQYLPQSFSTLYEGYRFSDFRADLFAGVAVAILALPLAMAFAVGSGVSPERGLFTVITAGFVISFFGGTKFQIGGPTGAFVMIIADIVYQFGYSGLVTATFLAGILLLIMGALRCGGLLRFIPYPVTSAFTTGIGILIFTMQIRDFFGLEISHLPMDFVGKWCVLCLAMPTIHVPSLAIALTTMVVVIGMQRFLPRWPGAVVAMALTTLLSSLFSLEVVTIGSRFGMISSTLPNLEWPDLSLGVIQNIFQSSLSIAILAGVESLLSGLVADGRTGSVMRPNAELMAQGLANIVSALFGGIPATGAFARTSANITLGAKTPFSGVIHALMVFVIIYYFSSLISLVPLATLSGILVIVAWNMCEWRQVISIFHSSRAEWLIWLTTLLCTVLIDIIVSIQVGVVLSALLLIKKISDNTVGKVGKMLAQEPQSNGLQKEIHREDPETLYFSIEGPLFYAAADLPERTLFATNPLPKRYVLSFRLTPLVDVSAIHALKNLKKQCERQGIILEFTDLRPELVKKFERAGLAEVCKASASRYTQTTF